MEIVALSCGKPQLLEINGQKLHSSIVHEPVSQLVLTCSNGVEDNELAAHNAPLYAFFDHHYRYWTERLGIDRSSWEFGHWGENITFGKCSSLSEFDFHLGDTWALGATAVLQVCGSRIPCNKLSWRCGQKDSWLKILADSGYAGWYFRVLQGGTVQIRDTARPLLRCPEAVTAGEITQAAFGSPLTTRNTMNMLVNDPNLLYMNKGFFERRLSMARDAALLGNHAWRGWRRLRVSQIVDETSDVKSFYLIPMEGDDKLLATYLPGQFLTLKLPTNNLIRSWSISDWEGCDRIPTNYRISIKKTAEASKWMHERCRVNSTLLVRSPCGKFCLDWSPMFPGRQVYISAGIGVTPILSMMKAHCDHGAFKTSPAIWIHVAADSCHIPMRDESLKLGRTIESIERHIFLTREPADGIFPMGNDVLRMSKNSTTFYRRRPKLSDFEDILRSPYSIDPLRIKPIEIEGIKSTCYICGSVAFESTVKGFLGEIGVPDSLVRSESFSEHVPSTGLQGDIEESIILFCRTKKTLKWKRSDARTILEAAESAGMELDYGCRVGSCGSCRIGLLKGSVTGANQESDGTVTVCCSKPATAEIWLDA